MLTQSMAITSWNQSLRGGSGRRNTSSKTSAHSPAIAVRNAVRASGSNPETARRVAGSVPPKIAMPIKPSNRPRCSRENGAEGMMPDVAGSLARVQRLRAPHGGHARLPQPETAPDQTDPG